jgi:disulfide bond formation protein DsbB
MCLWQRWGHVAVIAIGLAAWALRSRPLAGVAAVALLAAAALGAFHAGVEYGWWAGPTACTGAPDLTSPGAFGRMITAPLVRCDQPAWTLGLSMAGWNALISAAAAIAALVLKARHAPR